VGIVSRRDVLRTLLRNDEAIRAEVCERLDNYTGRDRWRVEVHDGLVTIDDHSADERERDAVIALTRTVAGVLRVHATGHRG
jgi:osmotically-inducible protein OsmY